MPEDIGIKDGYAILEVKYYIDKCGAGLIYEDIVDVAVKTIRIWKIIKIAFLLLIGIASIAFAYVMNKYVVMPKAEMKSFIVSTAIYGGMLMVVYMSFESIVKAAMHGHTPGNLNTENEFFNFAPLILDTVVFLVFNYLLISATSYYVPVNMALVLLSLIGAKIDSKLSDCIYVLDVANERLKDEAELEVITATIIKLGQYHDQTLGTTITIGQLADLCQKKPFNRFNHVEEVE